MKLKVKNLVEEEQWRKMEVTLPRYNIEAMRIATKENPTWVHFGMGNLFRGYIAGLQHRLLHEGSVSSGIVAVECYDEKLRKYLNVNTGKLTLDVTLLPDGSQTREVVGSVGEIVGHKIARLRSIFEKSSVQMVTLTITPEAYNLCGEDGNYTEEVAQDLTKDGFKNPQHVLSLLTASLYARFKKGNATPIALVSFDTFGSQGSPLKDKLVEIATKWYKLGLVPVEFLRYLREDKKVSYPQVVLDKKVQIPLVHVKSVLKKAGLEGLADKRTDKGNRLSPYVNGEREQHLWIENKFPNGRPPLDKLGVQFTTKKGLIEAQDRMETCCLQPLEFVLGIYGSLLGYHYTGDMMKDQSLSDLVHCVGYQEGLSVVTTAKDETKIYLDEVFTKRLPNGYMKQTPSSFVGESGLKMTRCFGETLKRYVKKGKPMEEMVGIPLAIAGWLRYLLEVDDRLQPMSVVLDDTSEIVQNNLQGIVVGKPETYRGQLRVLLTNDQLFGVNLQEVGLATKIEELFVAQLAGEGAVKATVKQHITGTFVRYNKEQEKN